MSKNDDEMLKKWLLSKEEKAFENGVNSACDNILNKCERVSEPILLSDGIDDFYVSIKEIKKIISKVRAL